MATPQFTYDPNDQSYAQASGGAPIGLPGLLGGVFGRHGQTALPQFSYDPATQEYTKLQPPNSGLGALGGGFFGNLMNMIFGGLINRHQQQAQGNNYSYDPSNQQYSLVGKKEGGEIHMNGYAQGGLAAAQHAQDQGRGQDTMLVHMTPKEVAGLQALAMSRGGSLTINPNTGLPEAGFLSAILPAIAGAALTVATGGAAAPWMIGLGVGGVTALATGSLSKGLMAGLGAYGGAGLGGALSSAGTAANLAAANSVLDPAAMLTENINTGTALPSGALPAEMAANTIQDRFGLMGKGLTSLFDTGSTGTAARDAFLGQAANAKTGQEATGIGGGTGAIKTLGMLGLPLMSGMATRPTLAPPKASYIRPYEMKIANVSGADPYIPGSTQERQMLTYDYVPQTIYKAAEGGLAALQQGGRFDDSQAPDMEPGYAAGGMPKKQKPTSIKGDPWYKFAQDRRDSSMEASVEQNFAAGGLPPRFLSGGGDGMSDSIKANIDGKQEARLADGEFVVPADVVSHLGNGSSKAGAKKLYSMMDRIRKARTGKERQAPAVSAAKFMPA